MTSCGVFPSGIFPIKLLSILFPPFLYTDIFVVNDFRSNSTSFCQLRPGYSSASCFSLTEATHRFPHAVHAPTIRYIPTSTHTAYSPSKAAQITNKQNDEKSSKTKHFALYCNSCLCEVFFIAMRYCAVPNQHKRRPHSAQYLVSPSVRPYVTHKLYSKYNLVPLLRTRVNINIGLRLK